MKKKVLLAAALIALMAAGAFAQNYNPESDFDAAAVGGGMSITNYKGSAAVVRIPPTIRNVPVVEIGKGAFDALKITSVVIPNSVLHIYDNAFYDCTSLASVTIPNSVKTIEQGAFNGCTSLASINIPNSVTHIGQSAFSNTGITSLIIPNNVVTIAPYAFSRNAKLASVTIGSGVTNLHDNAFSRCTSLTSVTFLGPLSLSGFSTTAFNGLGDIRDKFFAANAEKGTPGKYMRSSGTATTWAKQQ